MKKLAKVLILLTFFSLFYFGEIKKAEAFSFPNLFKEIFKALPFSSQKDEFEIKKEALLKAVDLKLETLNHSKELFEDFLFSTSTKTFSLSSSSIDLLKKLTSSSLEFINQEIEFYLEEKEALDKASDLFQLLTIKESILLHQGAIKRLKKEEIKKISENLTQIFNHQKIIEIASQREEKIRKDLSLLKEDFPKIEFLENLLNLSQREIILAKHLLKKEILLFLFKTSLKEKIREEKISPFEIEKFKEKIEKLGVENFSLEDDSDLNLIGSQIEKLIENVYENFETMASLVNSEK